MDKDSTLKLHTGREIPVMGLGTWQLTEDATAKVLHAIKLGYPMIDTSSDYGTHEGIGKALNQGDVERSSIYLVTKVEEDDEAYTATQEYLKQLQLDYADLIVIHRPPRNGPGIDLWNGLIKARNDGLTKDIGVSNYSISQIEDLIAATGAVPVVNQIEWSPFGHSREMLDYCKDKGILIQAYSPLTRAKKLDAETLLSLAGKYEKTPAQLLIRWNLQLGTIPIPKASEKEHQEENLNVFDFEISTEDMGLLTNLNEGYSALGPKLQYL